MPKQNFPNTKELFKDFTGREDMLRAITRYHIRPVMFYRPNLYTHSSHLGWILHDLSNNISEAYGDAVDIEKTILMGLVHDDLEIIMGDVQAAHKAKMSADQTADLIQTESDAIKEISKKFPENIGKYNYESLLREGNHGDTIEAQLMKFADQLDGLCESLHEVYGGNESFATKVIIDEYGSHPSPVNAYTEIILNFKKNHVDIQSLFTTEHPFLTPPLEIDFSKIAQTNQPHTKESLLDQVGYPIYDHWKSIVLTYAEDVEYKNLYLKKE